MRTLRQSVQTTRKNSRHGAHSTDGVREKHSVRRDLRSRISEASYRQRRRRAIEIAHELAKAYPDAQCELNFQSPLELLVATILSAQCTDRRVNVVTRSLFRKYHTADDYARAPLRQLERDIKSTGFYHGKARHVRDCCRQLEAEHGGEVPRQMSQLIKLPGVGRKTANVVLGAAFGIASGVVVDTHVRRLARRLGLTDEYDPVKIERDLMALLPKREWIKFSYRLAMHGRSVCTARLSDLSRCFLAGRRSAGTNGRRRA